MFTLDGLEEPKHRQDEVSTNHIRQVLSELEAKLRIDMSMLPQARELGFDFEHLPLSELIDLLANTQLEDTPQFVHLVRVDAALCQLDLGLYGLCSDCEAEIEADRLRSDPTEQRCASCAEHYQHEHRHELRLQH
jgi:DnaK suppressor protein